MLDQIISSKQKAMYKKNALLLAAPILVLLHAGSFCENAFPFVHYFNSIHNVINSFNKPIVEMQRLGSGEMKILGKGYYTEINGSTVSFDINASRPNKENASGSIVFKSSFLEFKGKVDCMNLVDGKMIVSGTMRHISKGSLDWVFVGIRYQFTFEDSGNSMSADRMSSISIGGPSDCVTAINLATPNEIKGNIQIIH